MNNQSTKRGMREREAIEPSSRGLVRPMQIGFRESDLRIEEKYRQPLQDFPWGALGARSPSPDEPEPEAPSPPPPATEPFSIADERRRCAARSCSSASGEREDEIGIKNFILPKDHKANGSSLCAVLI